MNEKPLTGEQGREVRNMIKAADGMEPISALDRHAKDTISVLSSYEAMVQALEADVAEWSKTHADEAKRRINAEARLAESEAKLASEDESIRALGRSLDGMRAENALLKRVEEAARRVLEAGSYRAQADADLSLESAIAALDAARKERA